MTIIRGESIADYHANDAESSSSLKIFRHSPLLYHRVYNEKSYQIPETRALIVGRAIDCLEFDGREEYAKRFAITPKTYPAEDGSPKPWTGNADYCKSWQRAQAMRGLEVISAHEALAIEWMHDAIKRHPVAQALLSQGEPQVTFRLSSDRFGMDLQVRPDWWNEKPLEVPELGLSTAGLGYQCDLKSTIAFDSWFDVNDPEDLRSGRPVYDLGYYRQAGLAQWVAYQDVGQTAHFLIVVEKVQPFRCGVFEMTSAYLDMGFKEIGEDLQRLRNCQLTNIWPGSVERVMRLAPQEWMEQRGMRMSMAAQESGLIPVGSEA